MWGVGGGGVEKKEGYKYIMMSSWGLDGIWRKRILYVWKIWRNR